MSAPFPFSAIVGQQEMKQALLLAATDPLLGGVLVFGDRGTGKSTAVRALAALLPPIETRAGCRFNCEPAGPLDICPACSAAEPAPVKIVPTPVVDLPLGATEDRVCGALDIEKALLSGEKSFEPGLLARANRGFLYIDEVNLLEDHLVDLLLDVAASGINLVEREGLSVRHPARFVLIGSGNPEEGELRPQLLDRFGQTLLEEVFRARGWATHLVTPSTTQELIAEIVASHADIVCLSWSTDRLSHIVAETLDAVTAMDQAIRPAVIAGGTATQRATTWVARMGADFVCDSAYRALETACHLIEMREKTAFAQPVHMPTKTVRKGHVG